MKKLFLSATLLMATAQLYAQDKSTLVLQIFQPLQQHTTRVVMDDDPKSYVLQHPQMMQEGELITVSSGEKVVQVPLKNMQEYTLENYGVVISGHDEEVTFYMDLKHNPSLRQRLQDAFDSYLQERDTKRYTVRE